MYPVFLFESRRRRGHPTVDGAADSNNFLSSYREELAEYLTITITTSIITITRNMPSKTFVSENQTTDSIHSKNYHN